MSLDFSPWSGGIMMGGDDHLFNVQLRGGIKRYRIPGNTLNWGHDGGIHDIVGYMRLEKSSKQPRYQDDEGEDWIDECSRTLTTEQFRGAMIFTIGKYLRRMGKKDTVAQEVQKVADYAQRWLDYEAKS